MVDRQLAAGFSADAVGAVLEVYRGYLVAERGLAGESVRCYLNHAKVFLAQVGEPMDAALAGLTAGDVTEFMMTQADQAGSVWTSKAITTALRSLLRFLQVEGLTPAGLVGAVPSVASWRLASLPRGLEHDQVAAIIGSCDLGDVTGRRDHAMFLLLARLGLRAAEVARLELEDVDWRAGEIRVCGKANRVEALPLPVEVGAAIAAYLNGDRPASSCRKVFVGARAPHAALTPSAVRARVGWACVRAGLPRLGAHRMRHTLATDMLRHGSGLAEVGQVLRHRSQLATAIYAKVDQNALRDLARPWPGAR
jgi:integrase/recombinase XerD